MPKKTVKALTSAFSELSALNRMKVEVDLLTRYSTDVIYRLRYDTMQYDYISPAVQKLLGYSAQALNSIVPLRSLILETRIVNDGMKSVESYSNLEETRKRGDVGKWQADYMMKTQSGKTIWVADISYPWFDKKGAIIGSIGSLRDISDRIEAEEKIRQELVRAGSSDELTGLANRQAFWTRLESEVSRIKRTQSDLSLLLIEVDNADRIKSSHGETVFSNVISGVAKLVSSGLRELDLAARIGSAEYGIVLPETSPDGAVKLAIRIRDAVARHTFYTGSEPLGCTASLGIASSRMGREMDATRLFKLADMRRYIARHTGGNRLSSDEMADKVH